MNDSIASYRLIQECLRAFDLAAMLAIFMVAAIFASPEIQFATLNDFLTLRLRAGNVMVFAVALLLWAILFQAHSLYSDLGISRLSRNVFALARAVSLCSFALWGLALVFHVALVNSTFIVIFWGGTLVLSVVARVFVAWALKFNREGKKNRIEYVVVGMNPRSRQFVRTLSADCKAAHKFLGFVDSELRVDPGQKSGQRENYLTELGNLRDYLRQTPVDEVVVCLPLKSHYDEACQVVSICEEQGITVRILADFFQTRITHSRTDHFGGQAVITVASHKVRGAAALLKRSLDMAISGALLVVLSPLFLITSLLVIATSPGPVFFSQERVGFNKKLFRMHKFRTMVADAEVRQAALENLNEAQGPVFKIHNDPRITFIGRSLRTSSIDELPQLLNVLKGEMSLVGPRPLPLRDYQGFKEDWHRRRLSVKPGITGLWQVKDRDHKSFDRWMKLDMQYIDEWSNRLDLKIILQTIPAVLRGSGE